MKISINTDAGNTDTEIIINCLRLTPEIEKMIALLRMMDMKLTGRRDGEIYVIDISEVLYIDTVDGRTFIYTMNCVYETDMRLYELEEQLEDSGFFRSGKSCILNMRQIVSLKSDIDRKIRVTMSNGEQLLVSRQYTKQLKERLGIS